MHSIFSLLYLGDSVYVSDGVISQFAIESEGLFTTSEKPNTLADTILDPSDNGKLALLISQLTCDAGSADESTPIPIHDASIATSPGECYNFSPTSPTFVHTTKCVLQ